jgi:hypothetical protein
MKRGIVTAVAAALGPALCPSPAWAQPMHLHVNTIPGSTSPVTSLATQ